MNKFLFLLGAQFFITILAANRGVNFGKTEDGSINLLSPVKSGVDGFTSLFDNIPLNKRRAIKVEHQSRSSKIICDMGLPFTRIGLIRLDGCVPTRRGASASRSFSTSETLLPSACSGSGGKRRATGFPLSVTMIVSPLPTNPKYRPRRFF